MMHQKLKRNVYKENEGWQEKMLKFFEPVDVSGPPPVKIEYIDVALDAVALQCKENLSKNEMLDVLDNIQ